MRLTLSRRVGVVMSYVAMIFEILSTLLITPLIIRTLGQAEYGVYKLTAAIAAYLFLLDLGVGNSVIRYMAKFRAINDREQSRKFFGIATIYYFIIAMIVLIVGAVLVYFFPMMFAKGLSESEIALGESLLVLIIINCAITLGTTAFSIVIMAYERFAVQKGSLIVQVVLRMGLTVVALRLGYGSVGIVCIQLGTTILCRGFYVLYVIGRIKLLPKWSGIDFAFVKEVFVYSTFILVQMIAAQVNAFADQILLGAFVTTSAAIIAVYGVGAQIVTYYQSIGNALTGVLMPGVVKMVESKAEPDELCKEMIRIGRMILLILGLVWCGFLIYGKQFICLWAGEVNLEGYYVAVILMLAQMIILAENIGTQILWAKNEHKEQAVLKLAVVFVNVVLTIVLIRWKPLLGATIGTFISYVVGDVGVMNLVFKKKIGIKLSQYYQGLLARLIPLFCVTTLVGWLFSKINLSGWMGFLINVGVMTLTYCIFAWLFGLNEYEKSLVKSILTSIKRRCVHF